MQQKAKRRTDNEQQQQQQQPGKNSPSLLKVKLLSSKSPGETGGLEPQHLERLIEVITGHVFWIFWVVDVKVGEEDGEREGWGTYNGPLAIHHGPVFDSPNACSWAASSIIHGYRRPGRGRAFYFSRVNNSCPLTQPRESRNRGADKQGSRWRVEPFRRTSTAFFSLFFLIWESAGVAPCSRPRCLPQRGGEGQLVDAGGRRTGALWPVNIILRNKRRARLRIQLRIQLTFMRVALKLERDCFGSKHPFSRGHIGRRFRVKFRLL